MSPVFRRNRISKTGSARWPAVRCYHTEQRQTDSVLSRAVCWELKESRALRIRKLGPEGIVQL